MVDRAADLARIDEALRTAVRALRPFSPGNIAAQFKSGDDPVTAADHAVNDVLRHLLPQKGEGWLSEETVDDPTRLECRRVWVVDPIDGTREFVAGIPEWAVSVGLVEDGRPVAGGILNPAAGLIVVGAVETGVTLNGRPARVRAVDRLEGIEVLASRSEVRRGQWEGFADAAIGIRPCGSTAYKLAQVAAGLTDAYFTLVPKNEWDVAAGMALVEAGGGDIWLPDGSGRTFNMPDPLLPGLVATPPGITAAVKDLIARVT